MKAVVGVAGGATRAALTQHQARRNNMAGKYDVFISSEHDGGNLAIRSSVHG